MGNTPSPAIKPSGLLFTGRILMKVDVDLHMSRAPAGGALNEYLTFRSVRVVKPVQYSREVGTSYCARVGVDPVARAVLGNARIVDSQLPCSGLLRRASYKGDVRR